MTRCPCSTMEKGGSLLKLSRIASCTHRCFCRLRAAAGGLPRAEPDGRLLRPPCPRRAACASSAPPTRRGRWRERRGGLCSTATSFRKPVICTHGTCRQHAAHRRGRAHTPRGAHLMLSPAANSFSVFMSSSGSSRAWCGSVSLTSSSSHLHLRTHRRHGSRQQAG